MNDLISVPQGDESEGQPDTCAYCGARLVPQFYFCLGCGTPYKHADLVVTPSKPMPLFEGELIRRKAPHVAVLFWTYFIVVLGVQLMAALFFSDDRPDLVLFIADGALLVTTCIFATMHWRTLMTQLNRSGFLSSAAWIGLAALVPMLLVNYYFHGWVTRAVGAEDADPISKLRELGLGQSTMIVVFCLIPAVTEELSFRGLVQHWLQVTIKPWRAVVLASFLFAVLHFSVISFLYLFCLGLLLGWMKLRTKSLYPSMLAHFLHNLAVIELFSGGG
ncbi:MAG: CPBP family intramembrane metalloprotease [Pirellulales bacterium]|nr:CPBP family intramembrane metalloprotease [Pirellulales bacterium]